MLLKFAQSILSFPQRLLRVRQRLLSVDQFSAHIDQFLSVAEERIRYRSQRDQKRERGEDIGLVALASKRRDDFLVRFKHHTTSVWLNRVYTRGGFSGKPVLAGRLLACEIAT